MKHLLSTLAVALSAVVMWGCSGGGSDVGPLVVKLDGQKVTFTSSGGSRQIEIAGPEWTATSSADWLTATQDEKNLVLKAERNYAAKRTAEVLVKAVTGEESQMVTVEQSKGSMPKDALQISSFAYPDLEKSGAGRLKLSSAEEEYNFDIKLSNQSFTWRVELDPEAKWLTCGETTAQSPRNNTRMKIKLGQNKTIDERTAVINILCEYKGGVSKYELTVVQESSHRMEDPVVNPLIKW